MHLIDRFLGHDTWTTRQLLEICIVLSDTALDQEHDIGHGTLRKTLDHIISNMEIWSSLMSGATVDVMNSDCSPNTMLNRLGAVEASLKATANEISLRDGWEELWTDTLDDPPRQKSYGSAFAHVVTHSMHHRSQALYMLRRMGVEGLPEGDVFSWETANSSNNSN